MERDVSVINVLTLKPFIIDHLDRLEMLSLFEGNVEHWCEKIILTVYRKRVGELVSCNLKDDLDLVSLFYANKNIERFLFCNNVHDFYREIDFMEKLLSDVITYTLLFLTRYKKIDIADMYIRNNLLYLLFNGELKYEVKT